MEVAERIRSHGRDLTAAERRVAEAILAAPQAVAFGTVADLAAAADVGAASVVRLATKLDFDGYSDLQACIQGDLAAQLRPAAERIHDASDGARTRHIVSELANVRATLESVDDHDLAALVARLADLDREVVVLSGEASAGVADQFAAKLHQLRGGVSVLRGSEVAVRRDLALIAPRATALVIDLRRYEQWVLDAHAALSAGGIWSAGLTDSMLSPIATRAEVTFVLAAESVSPFDSHVGTLALLNLVVAEVATTLKMSATERLADIESSWAGHGSLVNPPQ